MTIIPANDFRKMFSTGQIKVGKNGRLQEQSVSPDFKKVLKKDKVRFINEIDNDSDKETDEISFIIPCALTDLNTYINIERKSKWGAADLKNKLTAICCFYAKPLKGKIDPMALYDLKIIYTVPNNKIDADNIYFNVKFLADGIVKAGVIKDDTRKHIRHIANEIYTVKGLTQFEVKFIKIK